MAHTNVTVEPKNYENIFRAHRQFDNKNRRSTPMPLCVIIYFFIIPFAVRRARASTAVAPVFQLLWSIRNRYIAVWIRKLILLEKIL